MDMITQIFQLFVHLDQHLAMFVREYGAWTYLLLFVIIFCETGLVIFPFLPGDSLLFVSGTVATLEGLNVHWVVLLLILAAIGGDSVNYWVGKKIGPKAFDRKHARFFRHEYLTYTQHFYEKHGGKTIFLARFMPIIRTFAPFVAGIGQMQYQRFLNYNVIGAVVWIVLFVYAGYFFGNIPTVKENLTLFVFGIVFLSILPGFVLVLKKRFSEK